MPRHRDLLIEIGTEELPPKSLQRLSQAFTSGVRSRLEQAGLECSGAQSFATPRRLAVLVEALIDNQPDRPIERRGPALTASFDDDGNPTKAAMGFARSCGVDINRLDTDKTDKGAWLVFRTTQKGAATVSLIPGIVAQALASLPITRRMRWGSRDEEFVRPVHWVVLLFGNTLIDASILGVQSSRETSGHRFLSPKAIKLKQAGDYEGALEKKGKVIASFSRRRDMIRQKLASLEQNTRPTILIEARSSSDGSSPGDYFTECRDVDKAKTAFFCAGGESLLDEVTSLVEFPEVYSGCFNEDFLTVPIECLTISMKQHQKYFPVFDHGANLQPCFIIVSNIQTKTPDHIIRGNERVLNARLGDARFFFDQDKQSTLESRVSHLGNVLHHKKLGSQLDRVNRIKSLARLIAQSLKTDVGLAERTALLCKSDLMTDMVGEFPELQGVMGKYYALHDGEPDAVASAIEDHYRPRFAGDVLPEGPIAAAVALADKLDTLVGIFGIGEIPGGDRDPFALRRAALGVMRIIIEQRLNIDIIDVLTQAKKLFGSKITATEIIDDVYEYMMGRLRQYYLARKISPDVFESVRARKPRRPYDFDQRIRAVTGFRKLSEAESLAAANKRISNILSKTRLPTTLAVNETLLQEDAERSLASRLDDLNESIPKMVSEGHYSEALTQLATLREPVDHFFDDVMVMVDDKGVRDNRLSLLNALRNLFLDIADISCLEI